MDVKQLIVKTVKTIQSLPDKLSGEDSALVDPWEEIKEQIHNELSPYWPVYRDTINSIIKNEILSLPDEERHIIAQELKMSVDNIDKIVFTVLRRVLARARKEKIKYSPYDFDYFTYKVEEMTVYAKVVKRTGLSKCEVIAYSPAAPSGERGEVDIEVMEDIIDQKEFETIKSKL